MAQSEESQHPDKPAEVAPTSKDQTTLPKIEVDWAGRTPKGQIRFFMGKLPGNEAGRAIVATSIGWSPIELDIELVDENGFSRKIEKCGFYSVDCKVIKVNSDVPETFKIKVLRLIEK